MIALQNISWSAGNFALVDVNFEVPTGAYGVLMGPTGSGKTSLVELITGLRQPHSGTIRIATEDVTRHPPARRGIGYVPQDGALFPTMTISEQLGFAQRLRKVPVDERTANVEAMARQLGIDHLLNRLPHGLSGGERQRVALGRALLAHPRALLLDEPLSALDETTRASLVTLLRDMWKTTGLTALHITHSPAEAAALATHVYLIENGRVRPRTDPDRSAQLPR